MNFKTINRRGALGWLGVAVPGLLVASNASANKGSVAAIAPVSPAASDPLAAPAPVALVGLAAGSYRVAEAGPIERGAFQLRLADDQGDSFLVDICAFDGADDAPRGPARTSYLELFVVNAGHGGSRTHEGRGLAVMALAASLQHHEHVVPVGRLLVLRDRQRLFSHQLYADFW